METVPADVLIARAVRVHTRAIAALAIACVVLALVGVAALSLAGEDRGTPPITAGLSLLGVGQLAALVAVAIAALGLVRVLRDVGEPGERTADHAGHGPAPADLPRTVTRATAARLAILMRVLLGACVLAITVWALADPAGLLGAVVGALVAMQLFVVIALLRVHMLRTV